ncbi:Exonuclease mut-7-like protein [Bienertia sinuspersici]
MNLIYIYIGFTGKSKATTKFRALQQQVNLALRNTPQPGPAVFIVHCLYVLPVFEAYADGFSHLIVSALRKYLKANSNLADLLEAQDLAAQLFLDVVQGTVIHDERILIKIIEVFDVKLVNVEKALRNSAVKSLKNDKADVFMEKYIHRHIESQSYMAAVSLLEQFGICHSGESFLFEMLENKDFRAAEKWASYMGKSMLGVLVQEYVKLNMLKGAYGIIKRNNLQDEFPDIYHKCKESSLKTLAEKGCWDVAEERAKNDRQLLEFLVYLAMEAGYSEKVDELCERYSLEGFVKAKEPEVHPIESRYLHLHELFIDDIIWVDGADSLEKATSYIEGCKVVGVDCEWKPNYVKGNKGNKVSIMQIASEKVAFIFDLIKLYDDAPDIMNSCLIRILHSPRILKLGYNFQCDMHQLARSYQKLDCFKRYEMLLDIQKVFKEPCGGLSGLVKKILGTGLNKTRRNSNWELRPLSQQQLEYAALDAVVLVHLFHHIGNSQPADIQDKNVKMEWKSHIVSAPAKSNSNESLFKAVIGIWGVDRSQAARLHILATPRCHGRKTLEVRRNLKLKLNTLNSLELLTSQFYISAIL